MEIGLVIPHTGPQASPSCIRDFSITAERAGIDGLWAVDHLVLPHHTDSAYVLGREPASISDGALAAQLAPNYEMVTTLAWVAAHTQRIALGTSVSVLPLRNAILNARQLATLDIYSGGRLRYGVGVGWLREEAVAMGMPWDNRGARAEEHLALLRAVWCAEGELVDFHGEFHDVPPMDPEPRPVQRPIPIYIGGHSDLALDRAVRVGNGWIAAPMPPERFAEHRMRLHRAADAHGRDPAELWLVASMTPRPDRSRADQLAAYAEAGADHLQVLIAPGEPAAVSDDIERLSGERPS